MSIRVGDGTVVTLTYRLQTDRGDVLEDRPPDNPFEFEFGMGQTLPAIENVIRGKTEGFEASIGIAAKEAYGLYREDLLATVAAAQFPNSADVRVGMKFQTVGPDGEEITVRVVEVTENTVTVDGNHPLAGVDIEIDLKILGVRDADEVELTESPLDDDSDDGKNDDDDPSGRILH